MGNIAFIAYSRSLVAARRHKSVGYEISQPIIDSTKQDSAKPLRRDPI